MTYSPLQLACITREPALDGATDSLLRMAGALLEAQLALNPHPLDAALFAASNPLSEGASHVRTVLPSKGRPQ